MRGQANTALLLADKAMLMRLRGLGSPGEGGLRRSWPFLMPIETLFSIDGPGTVVTGKIEQGKRPNRAAQSYRAARGHEGR